jgi:hemerythrin-like domain-containing protein
LEKQGEDRNWQRAKAGDVVRFFDSDLVPHFRAEENVLFPTMHRLSAAPQLIEELLSEHRKIERLVDQLRHSDCEQLTDRLIEFADLLESHIRKEERDLFPVYERLVSPEIAGRVEEEIKSLIGTALQPKNPELLE